MKTDTLVRIRGGHVIDPSMEESAVRDVWIVNGRIVRDLPENVKNTPDSGNQPALVDASGSFVFPGLVDYHLHMFHGGTEIGLQPDPALLPQGVTLAVDQGSSGVANCEAFHRAVLATTTLRTYAFLLAEPYSTLPVGN